MNGIFTAAQAQHLNDEEFAHYVSLGLVEVSPQRMQRALKESGDAARELAEEARHEAEVLCVDLAIAEGETHEAQEKLDTIRSQWDALRPLLREFSVALLGDQLALRLEVLDVRS